MAFPGAEGVPSNMNIDEKEQKPEYTEFYTDFQIPTIKKETDKTISANRREVTENLPVSQNWVG